jgi:hypothetical protein
MPQAAEPTSRANRSEIPHSAAGQDPNGCCRTSEAGALCTTLLAATGITNKSLRALMTGLTHAPYSPGQMTYDLRRLRLTGLIARIERTHSYVLTPDQVKVAVFYTKLHNRLLRPLLAAGQPPAPPDLRAARHAIDQHINSYITRARLTQAARKLDTNVQNLVTKDSLGAMLSIAATGRLTRWLPSRPRRAPHRCGGRRVRRGQRRRARPRPARRRTGHHPGKLSLLPAAAAAAASTARLLLARGAARHRLALRASLT